MINANYLSQLANVSQGSKDFIEKNTPSGRYYRIDLAEISNGDRLGT